MDTKQMPPRRRVGESEIEESFLRGSGPGGQKINKTSSAVQLKHIPTGLVVKSQDTRSQSQNRRLARKMLAEKLDLIEKGPESRIALKRALLSKRKGSAAKKKRRKYKKLDEEKTAAAIDKATELPEALETIIEPQKEPG
ncbi:MAG: hypothetical protein M1814_002749 [Vezdaea aestivalis]|nr:MAG: hypothetical protein M1814_002749 [Vezdaea aestivalis]